MLYFWKAWGSRISNITFLCIRCKMHKYTKRSNMCYIFKKLVVQGFQLWSSYHHINLKERTVVLWTSFFLSNFFLPSCRSWAALLSHKFLIEKFLISNRGFWDIYFGIFTIIFECFCEGPSQPFWLICVHWGQFGRCCPQVCHDAQANMHRRSSFSLDLTLLQFISSSGEAPEPGLAILFWLGALSGPAASFSDGQGLSEPHCGSALYQIQHNFVQWEEL